MRWPMAKGKSSLPSQIADICLWKECNITAISMITREKKPIYQATLVDTFQLISSSGIQQHIRKIQRIWLHRSTSHEISLCDDRCD